jgi:hypothetical protein
VRKKRRRKEKRKRKGRKRKEKKEKEKNMNFFKLEIFWEKNKRQFMKLENNYFCIRKE